MWLNNLNQQRIFLQERSNLKKALKEELLENKESLKSYKSYVEQCHEKIIKVLNVSAGENNEIPMNSLRKLVIEMLPVRAINFVQLQKN